MMSAKAFLLATVLMGVVQVHAQAAADQTRSEWSFGEDMPSAWGRPCVVEHGGLIRVMGRPEVSGGCMDVFDPSTGGWSKGARIPFSAEWYGAVPVNGRIVAIVSDEAKTLRAVEYDPGTDHWIMKSPSPRNRLDPGVCAHAGKLWVFGGFTETPGQMPRNTRFSEVYDPATDEWQSLPDMPTFRHASSVAAIDGRIFVTGGVNNTFSRPPSRLVEVYDPVGGTWAKASPMPVGLAYHTVAVVGGRLYAIGGHRDGGAVLAYDYAKDSWEGLGASPLGYDLHKGIAVGDRVFVFGGVEGEWPNTRNLPRVAVFKP